MDVYILREACPADAPWMLQVVEATWGGLPLITPSGEHDIRQHAAIIALQASTPVGFLSYRLANGACEILAIYSQIRHRGIGTCLLERLISQVRPQVSRIWLVTTNDNLEGLRFFQKRGFHFVRLNPGAMRLVRLKKSNIPLFGNFGIPLRDMLELEQTLD